MGCLSSHQEEVGTGKSTQARQSRVRQSQHSRDPPIQDQRGVVCMLPEDSVNWCVRCGPAFLFLLSVAEPALLRVDSNPHQKNRKGHWACIEDVAVRTNILIAAT